jgi:hypothetical protein
VHAVDFVVVVAAAVADDDDDDDDDDAGTETDEDTSGEAVTVTVTVTTSPSSMTRDGSVTVVWLTETRPAATRALAAATAVDDAPDVLLPLRCVGICGSDSDSVTTSGGIGMARRMNRPRRDPAWVASTVAV